MSKLCIIWFVFWRVGIREGFLFIVEFGYENFFK